MKRDTSFEIASTLKRLSTLIVGEFDITDFKNIHKDYYFSIITEILIHLNDLLQKLKQDNNEIIFDVTIEGTVEYEYSDITSLVNHFRNAACHNDSDRRKTKQGNLFANCVFAAFDYPDDITLIMGDSKLLIRRHIINAFKEAFKKYSSYQLVAEQTDYIVALSGLTYYKYLN